MIPLTRVLRAGRLADADLSAEPLTDSAITALVRVLLRRRRPRTGCARYSIVGARLAMASTRPAKLVLTPGRSKLGMLLFATAAVAVCGVGVALDEPAIGWPVVTAAAIAAALCWGALSSPRLDLRLNQSGFAYGTLIGRSAFSWCDVETFGVVGFGPNRLVAVTLAGGVRGGPLAALGRRLGGFDLLLTESYGLPADVLARLLESWRARYGKRHINPAIVAASKVACGV